MADQALPGSDCDNPDDHVQVVEHQGVSVLLTDRAGAGEPVPGAERLADLLAQALRDQGVVGPAEVGLGFVDVETMAELNRTHMGAAGPTDVLAFPIDGATGDPDETTIVGDIVIAPQVAERSPQPLADELALLVVHGGLHLLGHDHADADEKAAMWAAQTDLLDRLWRGRP